MRACPRVSPANPTFPNNVGDILVSPMTAVIAAVVAIVVAVEVTMDGAVLESRG